MRLLFAFLLLFPIGLSGQTALEIKTKDAYSKCEDSDCRMHQAFLITEHYLQIDELKLAQHWLDQVRELNQVNPRDSIAYFVDSMQSEIFYYMGLHQFGIHEAQKGLNLAQTLKDSAFMADANLFIGINYFELKKYDQAQKYLFASKKICPKNKQENHVRELVRNEHIFNNIAQLKMMQHELDSAFWYIGKAIKIAREIKSERGIPNTLQTKGLIFLEKKQVDSARYYLNHSSFEADKFNYPDIITINLGYLMQCSADVSQTFDLFNKAQSIINKANINSTYRQIFYTTALEVFKKKDLKENVILIQDLLIESEAKTRLQGNEQIQSISNQYIKSENRLLLLRIEELNRQRKTALLQLFAALLGVLLLLLVVISIRRTSKHQKMLLKQKSEISEDLHDDIGSGLSSILINADLLSKLSEKTERQQILSAKITATGKEVSQRLHTFIWSLNNDNNSLRDFCEYVRHYAHSYFDGTAVVFSYEEDITFAHTDFLNGQIRKQLFFCIKEILNNSLKHSNATSVSVNISADKKQVSVLIADNGCGLQNENIFGNGLNNIQKRIELLNGNMVMESNNGLETLLSIPY